MNAKPSKPLSAFDEAHARELLAAWRATNQPLTVFCRARNVSYHSLYRWRRVLDAKVPVLLEVKVAAPARPATYEVILAGGRVVRVGDDFHDDTLARLVAALERAC